eukprot:m51a1_g542 putative gata-binding transcription factor (226) ;mRNA; f:424345-425591
MSSSPALSVAQAAVAVALPSAAAAACAEPLALDPASLEEETRAVLDRTSTSMPVDHRHRWTTVRATSEWIVRAMGEGERRGLSVEEVRTVEQRTERVVCIVREVIAEVTAATIAQQKSLQIALEPPAADAAPAAPAAEPLDDAASKRRGRPPLKKPMFCMQCGTTSTPEWRRGERGPNTLCNACGLQYSKRRRIEREAKKRCAIDNVLNPPALVIEEEDEDAITR